MLRLLVCLVFLFTASFSFGAEKILTIGCSYECNVFYRFALTHTARTHQHKIRIIDLSKQSPINWNELDGILIPGGADINPAYYLSQVEPELAEYTKGLDYLVKYTAEGKKRDPFEFGLLKEYFANEKYKTIPILGICRGMQMLTVSQGIPLYVDIKKELGIRNRRYVFDQIQLSREEDSLLGSMFESSFIAFKQHHQGLRVPYFNEHRHRWPHLYVSAHSHNGKIAESLEFRDRPVLGVQFHSEKDFGYERHTIFGWFLDKAALAH